MALRIGRASPANDAMSSTIGVSNPVVDERERAARLGIGPSEGAAKADVTKTFE